MTGINPFPLYIDRKYCSFAFAMTLSYLNASYSVFSYAAKRYAAIPAIPPLPAAISVELSSRCNLTCPECVTGTGLLRRKNSYIRYDLASEIAAQFRGRALSAWLSFQGEPMMHPDFFRMLELFEGMNPVISTNGHFLDIESCTRLAGSPLKRIIISYDGVTRETYGMYRRGGDHTLVREGIIRLAAAIRENRSRLKIVLQFLVHRGNEHEIPVAAGFARSVGAGFRVKSMQVLDPDRAGEWMPSDHRLARYACGEGGGPGSAGDSRPRHAGSEAGALGSDGHGTAQIVCGEGGIPVNGPARTRGCLRMWTSAVITTDGDVVPCCFDKNGLHTMGNLAVMSFSEIWRGKKYGSFRENVMRDRKLVDICSNCPEGRRLFF
ncbi:radical SAM protein [bacterium]|nr:radical SAM protein [bacterium]